jgi:hypothetical protein
MGWKGTLRSINAVSNRIAKEQERNTRLRAKEVEKLSKKIEKLRDQKEKVKEALNNEYASGKIQSDRYKLLSSRMEHITDELIVFGKTAGVTLGKRYVCGKIEKEDFDKLCSELVPKGLYEERDLILSQAKLVQKNTEDFRGSCKSIPEQCNKCLKPKGFFRHLKKIDNITLCNKCSNNYGKLKYYSGFQGVYLIAKPCEVSNNMTISVSIRQEYL